jgi:hypothetical protein
MSAFQPDALTISRGDLWANRRRFAEAVLDTGSPLHRLAQAFAGVAVQEADALVAAGGITWDTLNTAFQRITRRVVFGEAAAADQADRRPGRADGRGQQDAGRARTEPRRLHGQGAGLRRAR